MLTLIPNVYALTSAEQYNSGFLEGGQQAQADFHSGTFKSACNPTGAYSTYVKLTRYYCAGWVKGYTAKWNYLVRHVGF
jgi:hypothetical protein